MRGAYYNEIDPYAAQWLRNLIAAGHIAPGEVDTRSIAEVRADDLRGFAQCHFFAGIGGWSYALRLAGWDDARSVWTGSCPCQPFSDAGQRRGLADPRHLWPVWFRLIGECSPCRLYGEQVASGAALAWLDVVFSDMEGAGYACGAADLCAAGLGAPHIRQRLFWVADDGCERGQHQRHDMAGAARGPEDEARQRQRVRPDAGTSGVAHGLADDSGARLPHSEPESLGRPRGGQEGRAVVELRRTWWGDCDWIDCRDGKRRPIEPGIKPLAHGVPCRVGRLRAYGNALVAPLAATFIRATD